MSSTEAKPAKAKKDKKTKKGKNPYLKLTFSQRVDIDKSQLNEQQLAWLYFADEKRIAEARALAASIASDLTATMSATTSKAFQAAMGTAGRRANIKNPRPAAEPASEPGETVWITRNEAAKLIAALSGALADTDYGEDIDLGDVL